MMDFRTQSRVAPSETLEAPAGHDPQTEIAQPGPAVIASVRLALVNELCAQAGDRPLSEDLVNLIRSHAGDSHLALSVSPLDVARYLLNLGALEIEVKQYDRAEEAFLNALRAASRLPDDVPEKLIFTVRGDNNLASLAVRLQKAAPALCDRLRAHLMNPAVEGMARGATAMNLHYLQRLHDSDPNFEALEVAYQSLRPIVVPPQGPERAPSREASLWFVRACLFLGHEALNQDFLLAAQQYASDAIQAATRENLPVDLGYSYRLRGISWAFGGRFKEAIPDLASASEIMAKGHASEPSDISARILSELYVIHAAACYATGNRDSSESSLRLALQTEPEPSPETDHFCYRTLNGLLRLNRRLGSPNHGALVKRFRDLHETFLLQNESLDS